MVPRKIDRRKIPVRIKKEIKEYIRTLSMPFSIQDIAKEFNVSWHSARAILLELALEGEIKAMKTTRGYIFFTRRDENE